MDILTEKGQESKQWEDDAVDLWHRQNPLWRYVRTLKDQPAVVDGIIVKDELVRAVVETKCRQCSVVEFAVTWESKWLVTSKKIKDAAKVAEALCVPFLGFLYLPEPRLLMYKTLWTPTEGWVTKIEEKETRTQATINGGSIVRLNAFIDMTGAKRITGDDDGTATERTV